jgi:hypothetical protein
MSTGDAAATVVAGVVGLGAAIAIGFGMVPSSADMKRVEAKADRVEVAEREIAVQGQQIKEIKRAVERIETRQTAQFDRVMSKLDAIEKKGDN